MNPAADRRTLGRTFDRAASEYEEGRPGYPPALVDWWDSCGAFPAGGRALDLGAGTGKLTRALVRRVAQVIAVEPLARMRDQFVGVASLRGVAVIAGGAEAIPLATGSVDAVVAGQAFHWFDAPQALAEIARVLRPGGGLGLAWNDDDLDGAPDWVRLVHERKVAVGGGTVRLGVEPSVEAVAASGWFALVERAVFRWVERSTRAQALASLASRSYVIAMDDAARRALLDEVAAALPAGDLVEHPLVTAGFWCRRQRANDAGEPTSR